VTGVGDGGDWQCGNSGDVDDNVVVAVELVVH